MNDPTDARRLRQLLVALVLLLTFEGLLRKASPSELRVPLFLLKDVLVVVMAFFVARMPLPPALSMLSVAYTALAVFMVPAILMTAWHDPILAVFGVKQYLLYPVVAFATFMAFKDSKWETIFTFFRWIALLVIPTTLLALVQSRLPTDNWMNMSVSGESMKNFSSGGELRVSSTFSFVAQYCAFLNAEVFIVLIALYGSSKKNLIWKITLLLLVPALVLSCFLTISRSAVAVNFAITLLAAVLVSMKFRMRNVLHIILFMGVLYLAVVAVNHFSPKAAAAYTTREDGRTIGFSSELRERVFSSFFQTSKDRSMHTLLGNGLGVMSNGSDSFSSYANTWRERFWTETDFATTLFEGGYYLVLIWYGFRLFVILLTFLHFLKEVTSDWSIPMGFCQAYVAVMGIFATLALQPPIAIWWWLGVGTMLLFSWKCTEPPEADQKREEEENKPPPPRKKIRGRSLYADVIHSRK